MKKYIFSLTIILVLGALVPYLACKTPARFEVTSLDITPKEITAGQSAIAKASIVNVGQTEGTYHAVLMINGIEVEAKDVILSAGARKDISFPITKDMPGSYNIAIGNLAGTLKVLKPAEFKVINHSITPNPAKVGESVEINIEVQNLGEAEGTYAASLKVDGKIEETKQITLSGGTTRSVSFIISRSYPDTYEIEIGGVKDTMKIIQPVRLPNGTFLVKKLFGGLGELTVENGLDLDAVIILAGSMGSEIPLMAVYIRSNDSYTLTGIRDGTYIVYFCIGENWDKDSKKFTARTRYERFEDELQFETTETTYSTYYTTYELTLHPVIGGTAETEYLNEEEFPTIQ